MKGMFRLLVGEPNTNVDPASTMWVVNALIKADKVFDLQVIPGAGHTSGGLACAAVAPDFTLKLRPLPSIVTAVGQTVRVVINSAPLTES